MKFINNTTAYNANRLNPRKARISHEETLLNKGKLACHGYSYKKVPEVFDIYPFTDKANSLETGKTFSFYGRVAIDLFTWEKMLLPKTKVAFAIIRARPGFYILSDNPIIGLKNFDCSPLTRKF